MQSVHFRFSNLSPSEIRQAEIISDGLLETQLLQSPRTPRGRRIGRIVGISCDRMFIRIYVIIALIVIVTAINTRLLKIGWPYMHQM